MKLLSCVVITLLISATAVGAACAAEDLPSRDPTEDCRNASRLFGVAAFNSCINQEQLYYDLAKDDWLNVSDKNKSFCVNLISRYEPRTYYQGLETCLNERLREQAAETPAQFYGD